MWMASERAYNKTTALKLKYIIFIFMANKIST